jgi:hypothetical protein
MPDDKEPELKQKKRISCVDRNADSRAGTVIRFYEDGKLVGSKQYFAMSDSDDHYIDTLSTCDGSE